MTVAVSVLVTGGCGFLGRHVVAHVLTGGQRVVRLDVAAGAAATDFIAADLAVGPPDLSAMALSTVFHVAGLAHVLPRDAKTRQRFFDVNVEGTRNLLLGLNAASGLPESLVLVSTVAVYGLKEGKDFDEQTSRGATDPYGESKLQAEDLVMEWGERMGVRIGIVRLPLAAGTGAPGNLGSMLSALRRGRYLGVGKGDARRSMVLAKDVARVLPQVAEVGGIFHLTDGHHPSFRELEEALCRALDRKNPKRIPTLAARALGVAGDVMAAAGGAFPFTSRSFHKMTSTLTFSDDNARRELGWSPTRVVDAAAELVA